MPSQTTTSFTFTVLIVGIVVILFFVMFFYLFIIQLHRRRILHQKEVVDLKVQYEQTMLQSQLEIQEQTFKNISQEIHDNIGQVLSLAKLNLNTIPAASENAKKIALTEELLGKAIADLRDLSKSLNTEKITDTGICEAIKQELTLVEKASAQIKTSFFCDDEDIVMSNEKTIITFRMMQEVLNNIIKHARATSIMVDIARENNLAIIKITDNGIGFDPENLNNAKTGIGLKSIKQRCKLINADCTIQSTPGIGTSVEIAIKNSYNENI
ncbi:MAG TPA: ATP-binding protein [Chitinophagaceae bacterium]|nr:ATP-binding protein [Chitinophagaceae bacterium]